MADQVNHPAHYNMGGPKEADGTAKYETIKVIEDWSLGFCMGNALKYILRAPHKGTEKQDLSTRPAGISIARATVRITLTATAPSSA